jgi:hypothetical protein
MKKTLVFFICIIGILPLSTFGQNAEFTIPHTYVASREYSFNEARNRATLEAQAALLQQLGVLVEARQRMTTIEADGETQQDFFEEVKSFTLGRIRTTIVEETESFTQSADGGMIYSATFNMIVDTAALHRHLDEIVRQRQQIIAENNLALETKNRLNAISDALNIISPQRYLLFSLRPEFVAGTSAMGAGGAGELGLIGKNGFYFSAELSGGAAYYGGLFNFGACFNKDGAVKNVLGVSAGYRNTLLFVNFKSETGETLKSETGTNIGITGLFWKLMFGREKNFDITNRFLLGRKKNPNIYIEDSGKIIYDEGFNATYILSIGYALTRNKR